MELRSPALAGGFFTTEPPGKPSVMFTIEKKIHVLLNRHSLNLSCSRTNCILDCNLCARPRSLSSRTGEFWTVLRIPFTGPCGKNGEKMGQRPSPGRVWKLHGKRGTEQAWKILRKSCVLSQVYLPSGSSSLRIAPTI